MSDNAILKSYHDAKKRWHQVHVDFERFKHHVESAGNNPDKLVLDDVYFALSVADDSQSALELFYLQYGSDIRRISLKIVKKEEIAEDILHEFMFEIPRRIRSYKGLSSLRGWLYTVIQFYSINYLRKIRYHEPIDALSEISVDDLFDHLDIHYCTKFFKEILPKALYSLKPEWQVLIRAKFFDGLTNREIATLILKTQEYNITRWLQKALEKMKKHLLKLADEKISDGEKLVSDCLEIFENSGYFE